MYEDDASVHIVLEYCEGGELAHAVGERHYSERTVGGRSCGSGGSDGKNGQRE